MTPQENRDPDLKTFMKLGLGILIPVVILLCIWAEWPAAMPISKNMFFN